MNQSSNERPGKISRDRWNAVEAEGAAAAAAGLDAVNPYRDAVPEGALTMTEGQVLAQIRREGRDMFFSWYLLHQRVRVLGAVIMRDAVSPWAIPVCNWLERKLTRG